MIRARFLSDADRRGLLACVKRHREDHGVARRANALLLLAEGWDSVAYDGWKGGPSRMMADQEADLCAWLEEWFFRETVPKYWRDFRCQVTDNFRIISSQNFRVWSKWGIIVFYMPSTPVSLRYANDQYP